MASSNKESITLQKMGSHSHEETIATVDLEEDQSAYENRSLDFRTFMALAALAIMYEATTLSFSLPLVVINYINADVGPSTQATWIGTAGSLACAVTLTVAGRCSDIFGRRYVMLAGNLISLAGCITGATAKSVDVVIAGTVLGGFGAGIQQLAYACISEIVPKRLRAQALGLVSAVAIPGSAFAAPIAYAMVAHLTWRWTFYIPMIMNGLAFIVMFIFYWPPGFMVLHPEGKTRWQQVKELDFLGLILFGGGLTCFLLGLTFGNNPYPWTSSYVIAPIVVGAIAVFICFPVWEVYCPKGITPLCPTSIFRNIRGFCMPLFTIFVQGMLLLSLQAFWPQEIAAVFTTVPSEIGWYGLAYGISSSLGIVLSGLCFMRFKHTKTQFVTSTTIMAVFTGLLATIEPGTPQRAIAFVAVAGLAIGYTGIASILIVQLGVEDEQIGVATGLQGTLRFSGGAVALAVYGSILVRRVNENLVPQVAASAIGAGLNPATVTSFLKAFLSGSSDALIGVEGITPAIITASVSAAKDVYSDAFRLVYLVSIAFGGVAILGALNIRSVDDLLTQKIAVRLERPRLMNQGDSNAKGSM